MEGNWWYGLLLHSKVGGNISKREDVLIGTQIQHIAEILAMISWILFVGSFWYGKWNNGRVFGNLINNVRLIQALILL